MPIALPIPIQVNRPDRLPPDTRRATHANFLQWLAAGDPHVAQEVHDQSGFKPFALSSLEREQGDWLFRVSLLDDALWEPFWNGLLKVGYLDILEEKLPIQEGWLTREHRTYASLAAEAKADRSISLQFLTPTSFRAGKLHYPLPEPRSVFKSLMGRWNAFAPEVLKLDKDHLLEIVECHMGISHLQIRTESVNFGRGKQIGFVGRVTFELTHTHLLLDEDIRRLNVLADYAFFCGVGNKTTQGMGQTRRLAEGDRKSRRRQ